MQDLDDPSHPGWAIWRRRRVEHRQRWERITARYERLGESPPPPYQPLPEVPSPGHLDKLVRMQAEEEAEAKTFLYWAVAWDGVVDSVTAERRATGKRSGAVTFDGFLSGSWIFDPADLSEVRHQANSEGHYTLQLVSRAEAEAIAARRGLTLPSEERLLEICEQRIGAMFGLSATPEERAERKRLMP